MSSKGETFSLNRSLLQPIGAHELLQRLARFVRKTLSFSKSLVMHDACLKLFLHSDNLERAAILM